MQLELILEVKKRKSAIGPSGANGNGTKPVLIYQIQEDEMHQIEAIKGKNYRPYQNSQAQQEQQKQTNQNNGLVKCTHCKKPVDLVEKCFGKFPTSRPQNQNNQKYNLKNPNS